MLKKKRSFYLTVVMLLACGFTAVIVAAQNKTPSPIRTRTGKPAVSARSKPSQGRTGRVYRSNRYKSASSLERAREARAELRKMRERELEKFEARQAERKARKLVEEEEIKASGGDKKVMLLQRKVSRLESAVEELEKRLELLETIISDEDPALIYEEMDQLQHEENTSVEE